MHVYQSKDTKTHSNNVIKNVPDNIRSTVPITFDGIISEPNTNCLVRLVNRTKYHDLV